MRTADFSAYDEMVNIVANTQNNFAFRGLFILNNITAPASVELTITYNRVNNQNQLSFVTKIIQVNLMPNQQFLLPLNGDGIFWNIISEPNIGQEVGVSAFI